MTNTLDQTLFDETIMTNIDGKPIIDKEMLYVLDQNGGSYNGQIQIDTSSLSNSGKWLSFSEAYLEIPFVITLKSAVNASASAINAFMIGLKNGNHHLIDSIQVDYNNTNVVQLMPYTNFYVGYKLMTSFSKDDLTKWGTDINFYPDTAGSFNFSNVANANGDGISNNVVNPATAPDYSSGSRDAYNDGFYQRLKNTSFQITTNPAIASWGNLDITTTVAQLNTAAKSYMTDNATATAGSIWQWNILATIPLKYMCDFFAKMPLVKGGFLRFTINYNAFTTTITTAANSLVLTANGLTANSGRTNPIMISSAAANNPGVGLGTAAGAYTISCGITTCTNKFNNSSLPSCRLYCPSYTLDPKHEEELITLKPTKEIIYTDIYNFNITNTGAGGTFNQILTNGIVNPQKLIVIPQLTATQANVGWANANTNPEYQSPFSSSPGTTCPLACITQFNCQIGGRNVFQQNFQYDFEEFRNELASSNAIEGAICTGLTSGLISKYDYDNGYRYYVVDLARRVKAEDIVPKSVTVQGTNNTSVIMDYICFIEFQRKIRINMLDGSLVSSVV